MRYIDVLIQEQALSASTWQLESARISLLVIPCTVSGGRGKQTGGDIYGECYVSILLDLHYTHRRKVLLQFHNETPRAQMPGVSLCSS